MKISTILLILFGSFAMASNALADTNKTTICHKGRTISVSNSSVPAHLDHGDFKYACEKVLKAVALFRCGPDLKILSFSVSGGVPVKDGIWVEGGSCSNAVNILVNNGFKSTHINSVYDATALGLVTDYGFMGPRVKALAP